MDNLPYTYLRLASPKTGTLTGFVTVTKPVPPSFFAFTSLMGLIWIWSWVRVREDSFVLLHDEGDRRSV